LGTKNQWEQKFPFVCMNGVLAKGECGDIGVERGMFWSRIHVNYHSKA